MIEIGLGSVQTWECDQMGHLNVQYYVARASESLPALAHALGLNPRGAGRLVATEHHIRFLKELRPGAPFTFFGGVLGIGDGRITVYQEMRNTGSGAVAATFVAETMLVDPATRAPRPLPAKLSARAAALMTTLPDHGAPRGIPRMPPRSAPSWDEADRLGLVLIQQGAVTPAECDEHGFFATRAYMGRVSDGIPNLILRSRGPDNARDERTGGAALEYRFVYRAAPRAGDLLALRSAVKALGGKTITWGHWLFDRETGQAVATAEAVGVNFDLQARKAIEISEGARRAMERQMVPSLSV